MSKAENNLHSQKNVHTKNREFGRYNQNTATGWTMHMIWNNPHPTHQIGNSKTGSKQNCPALFRR